MMHGCTPYGYDEEPVETNDTEDYEDWMAEYGDRRGGKDE